jgi:hypothetical protein
MRFASVLFLNLCAWWPVFGAAEDTAKVQSIADAMVLLCVGGGRTEATSGTSTDAELSLRSVDKTGNVNIVTMNKSSAMGLVNGLNNALSQLAADQADKVRACLQPVRDRLLDAMLPLPPNKAEANVEISDVATSYDGKLTVLDVKMRNIGDTVAVLNSIALDVDNKTKFVDCRRPRYSLIPVSAEYDMDLTQSTEKQIAHQINPNETERIKLRVVSSEAGAVFEGVKARVEAKYNKQNLVTTSEPFTFKAFGLVTIAGMFTPGTTKQEWDKCVEDNRRRFCALGISLYKDDPADVCTRYH